MKTLLIFIIVFLSANALIGQSNYTSMIIAKAGVNLRDKPSIKSAVIKKIPFGEEVYLFGNPYINPKADTVEIESLKGHWEKVTYKGMEGYIFSPLMDMRFKQHSPEFPSEYPQLLFEGDLEDNCGDPFFFNSNYSWYGTYKMKDKVELRKVEINLGDKITTTTNDTAIFLIGFPVQVPEHKVTHTPILMSIAKIPILSEIYPGQIHAIGNDYYLNAIGTVKEDAFGYCTVIENYQLRISEKLKDGWMHQNLLEYSISKGECGRPFISFIGKIDNDEIPDLILTASSTSSTSYSIFLSTYRKENKILEYVAKFSYGNCY